MNQSVVSGGLKIVFAMVVLVLGWLLATMVPSNSEIGGRMTSPVLVRRNPLASDSLYLDGTGHYIGQSVDSAIDSKNHPLRNEEGVTSADFDSRDDYTIFDPASVPPTLVDILPKRPESLPVQEVEANSETSVAEDAVVEEVEAITEIVALGQSKTSEPVAVSSLPPVSTTTSLSQLGNVAPPIFDEKWASAKDIDQEDAENVAWMNEIKSPTVEFPKFAQFPPPDWQDTSEGVGLTPDLAPAVATPPVTTPKVVAPTESPDHGRELGKLIIDKSAQGVEKPVILPVGHSETIVVQTVNKDGGSGQLSLQPANSSVTSEQTGELTLSAGSTFTPTAAMTPAEVAMRYQMSETQYRRFFDQNRFKLDSTNHFSPGTILSIPADR